MRSEAARAKVNLFLHVVGKRPDGYHLLDSLVVFAEAADRLEATEDDRLSLQVTGPRAAGLDGADNLVLRAAAALAEASGVRRGARLVLHKNLPVASGIGGGSADAAAALRLLDAVWETALPRAELLRLAAGLGADVPVCLRGAPARMGGVGELLGPAPALPPCGLLLVNPGVPLATAAVFGARQAAVSAPATLPPAWADARAMADDLGRLANDLEPPALRLCPAVAEALDWLRAQPGCRLARMSGSGATCFGLFDGPDEARAVPPPQAPGWWSWAGALA